MISKMSETKLPLWIFGVFFLLHFGAVIHYAVDIPMMDEWGFFETGSLSSNPGLSWFFLPSGNHIIFPTMVLTWVFYLINGWNIAVMQGFNFLLFGFAIFLSFQFVRKVAPTFPRELFFCFAIFLLTSTAWEVHNHGIQSNIHFNFIFFFLALLNLFQTELTLKRALIGGLSLFLLSLSFGTGVPAAAFLLLSFLVFRFGNFNATCFLPMGLGLLGIIVWILIVHQSRGLEGEVTAPTSQIVVGYFLNLISLGFGVGKNSSFLGSICLLICLVPLGLLIRKSVVEKTWTYWPLISAIAGILVMVATITLGRAGGNAKVPRYGQFSLFLVPLIPVAWYLSLSHFKKLRNRSLAVLWVLCCVSFWNSWDFIQIYSRVHGERTEGVRCVARYYVNPHNSKSTQLECPTIYRHPMAYLLENAKILRPSFYQKLEANHFMTN